MEPRIVTAGLGKSYGPVTALADVSVAVGPGRVLGVLGHNGAGKTTLVDILSTRCAADAGTAWVSGWDVARSAPQVRRARLRDRGHLGQLLSPQSPPDEAAGD